MACCTNHYSIYEITVFYYYWATPWSIDKTANASAAVNINVVCTDVIHMDFARMSIQTSEQPRCSPICFYAIDESVAHSNISYCTASEQA